MKEAGAVAIMEAMGDNLIAHDDKLLLRAVKTRPTASGRNGGIGLTEDWRRFVPKAQDESGNDVVTGYWNEQTGESHGANWLETLEGRERFATEEGWRKAYLRRLKLAEGVWLEISGNVVDLVIANLYADMGSRYRAALEYFIELQQRGVVRYRPKAYSLEAKNRQEALRNRLKRELKPTEYEHDILFRGEIGKPMFEAFRKVAENDGRMHVEAGTVYLAGFNRYDGLRRVIKFYDIGMREGGEAGKLYKLETTMLKAYFKARGIRTRDMLEQPKIQEMLRADLAKSIEQALAYIPEDGVMKAIQAELALEIDATRREITQAMLRPQRTLTKRVAELERWRIDAENRIKALEAERNKKR